MSVQVLLPMGGLGSRFAEAGFTTPKPLIEVDGLPMYMHSMASFSAIKTDVHFFAVVRKEHEELYGLASALRFSGVNTSIISKDTRGAAETALFAASELNLDESLVIADCDIRFRSPELLESISNPLPPFEGALTFFQSIDPRYSYAEVDEEGMVWRTAEKQPISRNALIGCYAFAKAGLFKMHAELLISKGLGSETKEFYMSLLFNSLIDQGLRVRAYPGSFDSFGTPEELIKYNETPRG